MLGQEFLVGSRVLSSACVNSILWGIHTKRDRHKLSGNSTFKIKVNGAITRDLGGVTRQVAYEASGASEMKHLGSNQPDISLEPAVIQTKLLEEDPNVTGLSELSGALHLAMM